MITRSTTIITAAMFTAAVIMITVGAGCSGGKKVAVGAATEHTETAEALAAERAETAAEEAVYVAISFDDEEFALLVDGVAVPLEGDDPIPSSVYVHNGDVYIAGSEGRIFGGKPQLWKNGERTIHNAGVGARLNAVQVHGGDVYAALNFFGDVTITGVMKNGETGHLIGLDSYDHEDGEGDSENGRPTHVTSTSTGMHVSDGGDVYLAGFMRIFIGYRGEKIFTKAALWKNGVSQHLAGGDSSAMATSVYTVGGDVYVVGYITENTPTGRPRIAALWKNGELTRLSDSGSIATSVFVSGGDVYVAGTIMSSGLSGVTKGVLWKNGAAQTLSDSVSSANSVYVYGGDVYVAGTVDSRAVMWKNGAAKILGGDGSEAYSIHVGAGGNWKPTLETETPALSAETGGETWARGSQFNQNIAYDSITDTRDGQTYRVVTIGENTWMAENLNYNSKGSLCYGNRNANCAKYGRLYLWDAAMTACPDGWRLPDTADWGDLMSAVGGVFQTGNWGLDRWRGAATKLRSRTGWVDRDGNPAVYGTDEYGFSAMPGGNVIQRRGFSDLGSSGDWWTATEGGVHGGMWTRSISNNNDYVLRGNQAKCCFISVRCVKSK